MFQLYINWQPEEVGNILYNDKKFVTLLYSWNNDYFTEYSRVDVYKRQEICKEHGLSVIPPSQNKGMDYKEYTCLLYTSYAEKNILIDYGVIEEAE